MAYSSLLYRFDRHYHRLGCWRVVFVELEQAISFLQCKGMCEYVSGRGNGRPGMRCPVECWQLERLFPGRVGSLIGRWNHFLLSVS